MLVRQFYFRDWFRREIWVEFLTHLLGYIIAIATCVLGYRVYNFPQESCELIILLTKEKFVKEANELF